MTVKEYVKYKNNELNHTKLKDIIRFWNTNPTFEQEELRSNITFTAFNFGLLVGLMMGFLIGVLTS